MAVYKFKITFEEYYEIIREIEILSSSTFLDFHNAIHASLGYEPAKPSSFYVSTDNWLKGEEITYNPAEELTQGKADMRTCKLSKFVNDPHQKFYYVYNFARPFEFLIELVSIKLDAKPNVDYPHVTKKVGDAPRMGNKSFDFASPARPTSGREFEFLSDFGSDEDELEELKHVGVDVTSQIDGEVTDGENEDDNSSDEDTEEGNDLYGSSYDEEDYEEGSRGDY